MTDSPAAPKPRRFVREITSIVAAPLVIWTIGWAPRLGYIAMMYLIGTVALWEFQVFGRKMGYRIPRTISMLLLYVLLAGFALPEVSVEMGAFAVILLVPASFVMTRHGDLANSLPASAITTLATLYVGLLTGSLIRLRFDFGDVGSKLVFFLFIAVWMGDTGAYYVGRSLGKHRLAHEISPKKSVEGLIGGVCASILAAAVMHFSFFPEFPLLHACIAAAILSLAGVVGDLAESMWKRSAAVKDSGALIPGHGGFLDRFDSILFTAPMLYAYWYLLHNGLRGIA